MSAFVEQKNARLSERYLTCTHASGLRIFLIPKEGKKAFALFGTRYGSMDNDFVVDNKRIRVPDGIAHFLEHKLFENADGSDTFSRFAALGASCNAFTSNEMTAYLFSATSNYDRALSVLLDFVTHPYFTPETVKKEQGIIGQELKMYEDDADYQLYYGLLQALYQKHPIKIDVGGTLESIAQITDQTLYDCYRRFYNLRNMALVLCGPFEPARVLAVCDEVLSPAAPFSLTRSDPQEPKEIARRSVERYFPVAMPQFALGLKEVQLGGGGAALLARMAAQEIALELYFGRGSAFFTELYEKGILNETFSSSYQALETCAFTLFRGESDTPKAVREALFETVKKARRADFSEADFLRCQKAAYGAAVQSFNAPSDIALQFLSLHFLGADLFSLPDALAAVDTDALRERLSSWDEDLLAESYVFPKGENHA